MTSKRIVSIVLLLFVAVSLAYLVGEARRTRPAVTPAAVRAAATQPGVSTAATTQPADRERTSGPEHRVIAYYFHGDIRCRTCRSIEKQAHVALTASFPDAMRSGVLEWRAVNVDRPENEHFTRDYALTHSSLVLVDVRKGRQQRWTNLEKVWELVYDADGFRAYVVAGARGFLENGS